MSLAFSKKQWEAVKSAYDAWWNHQLDRPILPIWLKDRDPGRPMPKAPLLSQETCADLSIPAEALIDRLDYELSQFTFIGDAFPMINFDCFGPGIVAAFLGARLDHSSGRVWFKPEKVMPLSELKFQYDPNNIWLLRIREIYKAGLDRWGDQVLLGIPDLGGVLDILSTFRPGELLLLDLIDEPSKVIQLTWELHELWHRYFNDVSGWLQGGLNPDVVSQGWTDWSGTFCSDPAYILQCDFSYMISPEQFNRFARPELEASASRLGHANYHLDGIGQLGHLDMILQIPKIHAIQWVPGDGKPPQEAWPEVFVKLHQAGKAKLVFSGIDGLHQIVDTLGTAKGICQMPVHLLPDQTEELARWLALM